MDVGEIRAAIADRIRTVVRCEPYVQDQPNVPCAVVYPATFEYGSGTFEQPFPLFTILLLAGAVSDREAQDLLDTWVSDEGNDSIVAAEVGGQYQVVAVRSYGTTTTAEGGVRYFSAELDLIVYG